MVSTSSPQTLWQESRNVYTKMSSPEGPKNWNPYCSSYHNSVLLTLVKSIWNHKALLTSELHRAKCQATHIPLCPRYHWPHSCLNISPWHQPGHSDQISPLSFTPSSLHISSSLSGASSATYWACVSALMLLEMSHYCGYSSSLCPACLSTV